jgi:hypothetical protein
MRSATASYAERRIRLPSCRTGRLLNVTVADEVVSAAAWVSWTAELLCYGMAAARVASVWWVALFMVGKDVRQRLPDARMPRARNAALLDVQGMESALG